MIKINRFNMLCPICGAKLKYDCDGVGHEWLDCMGCRISFETYESRDCISEFEEYVEKNWESLKDSKPNKKTFPKEAIGAVILN